MVYVRCPAYRPNAALKDGAVFVKRCGYFFRNRSSCSHVNSGPLLEFHRTLAIGTWVAGLRTPFAVRGEFLAVYARYFLECAYGSVLPDGDIFMWGMMYFFHVTRDGARVTVGVAGGYDVVTPGWVCDPKSSLVYDGLLVIAWGMLHRRMLLVGLMSAFRVAVVDVWPCNTGLTDWERIGYKYSGRLVNVVIKRFTTQAVILVLLFTSKIDVEHLDLTHCYGLALPRVRIRCRKDRAETAKVHGWPTAASQGGGTGGRASRGGGRT
ncbi:hypothetical protein Tco_0975488 [Tanacetum coccineum]|uniref:Uncharacterized protein n=1 Tax=Tanacetum coccineum TaxID=301880 RepID=A0ABQ5EEQ7_9ASTR